MLDNPFQLDIPPGTLRRRASLAIARPLLSWLVGARALGELYRRAGTLRSAQFEDRALEVLDVTAECDAGQLAVIPANGPLIVASNHPHGALDGLVLSSVLGRVRGDVRIMANHLLERIPELRASCFFVDPFGGPLAAARSRAGLRAAHLWLKQGGALVMFPAGEVAHTRARDGLVTETEWKDTIGRLAVQTGAAVLPAHIAGGNSGWFYAAGRLHPALRTALLGRELLKKRGTRVEVRFGEPASPHDLGSAGGSIAAAARARVETLAQCAPPAVARTPDMVMAAEIARLPLPPLVESGDCQVFCCTASEIPATLEEIGRLRAIAYRAVGEGSNRDIDLDRFDQHYLHLFSWNRRQRQIVGAYRLGRTDHILGSRGVDGLYTRTLFRYDRALIDRMSPALELGRSFVRAEYQRQHNALRLLWKGIGRFVVENPEYHFLFGPVSISARYTDASHAALMAFLKQNHLDESLAELVEAINPLAVNRTAPASLGVPRTIDEADALVSRLEADGKGMPVLLRQYLKLNARLIGFNVDADFGEVLDALMAVDLRSVDFAILGRYLGRDGAARLLATRMAAA
jgi:putative hemolysin